MITYLRCPVCWTLRGHQDFCPKPSFESREDFWEAWNAAFQGKLDATHAPDHGGDDE